MFDMVDTNNDNVMERQEQLAYADFVDRNGKSRLFWTNLFIEYLTTQALTSCLHCFIWRVIVYIYWVQLLRKQSHSSVKEKDNFNIYKTQRKRSPT